MLSTTTHGCYATDEGTMLPTMCDTGDGGDTTAYRRVRCYRRRYNTTDEGAMLSITDGYNTTDEGPMLPTKVRCYRRRFDAPTKCDTTDEGAIMPTKVRHCRRSRDTVDEYAPRWIKELRAQEQEQGGDAFNALYAI